MHKSPDFYENTFESRLPYSKGGVHKISTINFLPHPPPCLQTYVHFIKIFPSPLDWWRILCRLHENFNMVRMFWQIELYILHIYLDFPADKYFIVQEKVLKTKVRC